MNDFIKTDGHYVFIEVESYEPTALIDAVAVMSNFCTHKGILLEEGDASVRDNPNGTCTLRYKIERM